MDKELLDVLACPKCKGPLKRSGNEAFLCESCGLRFEIEDGIPNFLLDDAKPIEAGSDSTR